MSVDGYGVAESADVADAEELVALGELADDLIRGMSPALVRCHVVGDSFCPNTRANKVPQRLDHYNGLTSLPIAALTNNAASRTHRM